MAENEPLFEYSDLIKDDGTFQELTAHIKKLKKELQDLMKIAKKAYANVSPNDTDNIEKMEKSVNDLTKKKKTLLLAEKNLNKERKKTIDLTNEELVAREAQKLEQRERVQRAKILARISKEEKNSVEKLRAQLALSTLDWKKLTAEEIKNTKEGKRLSKTKTDLTKKLKKLEKATGDNRRNVGNYSSALSGLNGVMVGFGGSVGFTVGALRSMGGVMKSLVLSLKTFKGALIGTGIGALVVAFGALVTFLTRTQRGLDFVNQAFAAVTTTIDVIIDRISKFGEAIGLAFRGEFALAAEKFKESVSGVGDEIAKETNAAIELEKALQRQVVAERILRLEKAKAGLQIAELLRKAEESKNKNKKLSEEQLREALDIQQKISDAEVKFAKETLRITQGKIALGETLNDELSKEVDQQIAVLAADKAREDAIRGITRKLNSLTGVQKDNTKEIDKNTAAADKNAELRIKAIESIQKQLAKSEVDAVADKNDRIIALEKLRFEEEKRLLTKQFDEVKALHEGQADELERIGDIETKQIEANYTIHQQNLLNIQLDFAQKKADAATKTVKEAQKVIKEQQSEDEKLLEDFNKKKLALLQDDEKQAAAERKKGIEERISDEKKVFEAISETAKKVGALIVEGFKQRTELSKKLVTDQEDSVSRANDRAAKGLKSNLVFEEEQLNKRQSEQIKRQKEQEQAARFLALFNLVSAYASSGNTDALSRGLVDWGLMTAAASLYEGTEDTGKVANPMDSKGGRMYILHDNERVLPKVLNQQLGGMSNDMLVENAIIGDSMSDYQKPLATNYHAQSAAFSKGLSEGNKSNEKVVEAINNLHKQIASQPNFSAELVKAKEEMYDFTIKEVKRGMTKVYTKVKRRV